MVVVYVVLKCIRTILGGTAYASGSSQIQTLSYDSSSIKTEIWKDSQVIKAAFLYL